MELEKNCAPHEPRVSSTIVQLKIKILNIELAKIGSGLSGGEACFIEIAKRLPDFEQTSIIPSEGLELYKRLGLPGKCYCTAPIRCLKSNTFVIYAFRCVQALSAALAYDEKPDCIVSHSEFMPTLLCAFLLKLRLKRPWIAWIHMLAPNPFLGYRGQFAKVKRARVPNLVELFYWANQQFFLLLAKRFASKIIVTAPYTLSHLAQRVERNRISLVPYGVDRPSVTTQQICYDGLFVGRFHEQKGLDLLILAWRLVVDRIPNAALGIVGYGDARAVRDLQSEIVSHGLSKNIHHLGFKAGRDRDAVLATTRLFLFPSTYESFGIVALEAMAFGLPVVAFDLPVFEGMLDALIRVPFADVDAFADAVIRLLTNNCAYAEAVEHSKKNASAYSWQRSADLYADIVKKALTPNASPSACSKAS